MTVFSNSRYRFRRMILTTDETNTTNSVHKIPITTDIGPGTYRKYVCRARDTFESLASRFYDDADKWYVIADANPEVFFPLDLTSGTEIRIPNAVYAQVK